MTDKREEFFKAVAAEMTAILATADDTGVTMRTVSPTLFNEQIFIFTAAESKKYRQLKANPRCCLMLGGFFVEAEAEFHGACMLAENEALRAVYSAKFPGAFDENIAFGGRGSEFIVLKPTRLSGWAFENDIPVAGGIPTIPFALDLK